MKRKFTLLLLFAAMLFPVFAQKGGTDISTAINDAASEIARKVPGGSVTAVTNFASDTKELSEWLENEMFRALSKKAVKLVERNAKNMNILNREIDFQYSGAVSDDTIAEYGRQLGARYIIYGSFEQFGGMKNFDFRLTDVETFEVVTAKSYEIAKSQVLTELLGEEMELSSVDDYIIVLNNLNGKLNSVQKEMYSDRDRAENSIRANYQKKINAKTEEITKLYDGMYSGSKLRAEIANAVKPIEAERDELLRPVAENSRAKFADQISAIENRREAVLREMQNANFIVGADYISVELLRKMDDVTESAYFSISLRSTDKYVNYSLNDRIDPKTPADFKKIRDMTEKTKSVKGEIEYSLKQRASDATTFDITVSSVRVYDSISGDTVYRTTKDNLKETNGGTIRTVAQKGGTAAKKQTSVATTSKSTQIERNDAVEEDSSLTVNITTGVSSTETASSNTTTTGKTDKAENTDKAEDKSKATGKNDWRKNEGKKKYFDISANATYWYFWDDNYWNKDKYLDAYGNGNAPDGNDYSFDFNFSLPLPFGIYCTPIFTIEPLRANVGIRGVYAQALGLGWESRALGFKVYVGSIGLGNKWF